jgi:hypothetical protein
VHTQVGECVSVVPVRPSCVESHRCFASRRVNRFLLVSSIKPITHCCSSSQSPSGSYRTQPPHPPSPAVRTRPSPPVPTQLARSAQAGYSLRGRTVRVSGGHRGIPRGLGMRSGGALPRCAATSASGRKNRPDQSYQSPDGAFFLAE